jgi:hypothetical protein
MKKNQAANEGHLASANKLLCQERKTISDIITEECIQMSPWNVPATCSAPCYDVQETEKRGIL